MDAVAAQTGSAQLTPRPFISSETAGDVIRQIEAEHDLLQYEVDGWCVWPLLRFGAALTVMDLPLTVTRENFTRNELLSIALKDTFGLLFPRRAQYVALTLSSELMERDGERFRNVFFDGLLQELGQYFKIETLNSKSFFSRSRHALIPSDVTTTAFGFLSTTVMPRLGTNQEIRDVAERMHAALGEQAQLLGFSADLIRATLERFYWQKKLFSKLFRRIRPKFVFTADGYSDHAAIAAARENEIRVCEFQHGAFTKDGPEYGWSSGAAKYKNRMPLANQIFLFGDYWREQFGADVFWGDSLISVGSARMDEYRQRKARGQFKRDTTSCRILLTTQGLDTENLLQFTSDFLRLTTRDDIQLLIKLHPSYESDKTPYERALGHDARVRIISGSDEPSTYELLCTVDFHVSISSTCHFDALGLGVPTVILPLATSESILSVHRSGHAMLANTPQELRDLVVNSRGRIVPESLSSYYFKPNALENVKHALAVRS